MSASRKPGKRANVASIIGVSIAPGHTALTRMPCGAYSIAAVRVSPRTPCLLALYGDANGAPRSASVDATLTIAPRPRIASSSARIASHVPRRFTATMRSHSSTGYSWVFAWPPPTPAQFAAQSSRPQVWIASRTTVRSALSFATSAATKRTSAPSAPSAETTASPPSASMSDATTRAPMPASSSAVARPIPDAAPVTTATLPSRP